jgi:POT family proton-dependent oligopeptide transporter
MDHRQEAAKVTPSPQPVAAGAPDAAADGLAVKQVVAAGDDTFSNRHPVALRYFFWGEFAERSSYYGMRAILFLYLTRALHFSDTEAGPIYSTFKMACYFLPLLGGYVADRWLGRYWTIVGFSVPYVLGHFILGFENQTALIIALALLAGGSGVIKPNISTLMGQTYDQQRPGQERLRSAAFLWFYFSINIGALLSQLAMPELRDHFGYAIAFQFPAWLMVVSLAVFAAGKRHYAVETTQYRALTPDERKLQWQTLGQLFGIFALIVLYWVGYEHNDTLWIAFIRDYVELPSPPWSDKPIAPDQLQFLNALFVIILVPTFNVLFARLDPEVKVFTPMRKVLAGFLLTAAAVGIMAMAGFLAQGHTQMVPDGNKMLEVSTVKVSVWWPALAYIVLTFGEVLLYGTMLELAYTAAPKSMKGFVTACFLLTNTLANFINIGWTPFYGGSLEDAVSQRGPLPPGEFFAVTAGFVVLAAASFIFVGKRFERGRAATKLALEAAESSTAIQAGDGSPFKKGPSTEIKE